MTRNEFLSKLTDELKKNNIPDAPEIVSEYEEHFAFKMADGFSEEEIAAKLGKPAVLASQFEAFTEDKKNRGKKAATVIGLSIVDLLTGIFFVMLMVWEVIMIAFSLSNAVVAVCLFIVKSPWSLIPPIPYWPGAVFGLSLAALAVLSAMGCIYFAAFTRQLLRSYGRFHHNTLATASGKAIHPSLPIHPQLPVKANRRIRSIALSSLTLFAVCFVLGMIVSMISSGSFEFWHTWGWFGYSTMK